MVVQRVKGEKTGKAVRKMESKMDLNRLVDSAGSCRHYASAIVAA